MLSQYAKGIILSSLFFFVQNLRAEHCVPLFCGESSDVFVIRWAYQHLCDLVYDPRCKGPWPTASKPVTFDPTLVKAGDIIFVRDSKSFYKEVHPLIKVPYIIVSAGEAAEKMEDASQELFMILRLLHGLVFMQAKKITHQKFHPLPLGVRQDPGYYKKKQKLIKRLLLCVLNQKNILCITILHLGEAKIEASLVIFLKISLIAK